MPEEFAPLEQNKPLLTPYGPSLCDFNLIKGKVEG